MGKFLNIPASEIFDPGFVESEASRLFEEEYPLANFLYSDYPYNTIPIEDPTAEDLLRARTIRRRLNYKEHFQHLPQWQPRYFFDPNKGKEPASLDRRLSPMLIFDDIITTGDEVDEIIDKYGDLLFELSLRAREIHPMKYIGASVPNAESTANVAWTFFHDDNCPDIPFVKEYERHDALFPKYGMADFYMSKTSICQCDINRTHDVLMKMLHDYYHPDHFLFSLVYNAAVAPLSVLIEYHALSFNNNFYMPTPGMLSLMRHDVRKVLGALVRVFPYACYLYDFSKAVEMEKRHWEHKAFRKDLREQAKERRKTKGQSTREAYRDWLNKNSEATKLALDAKYVKSLLEEDPDDPIALSMADRFDLENLPQKPMSSRTFSWQMRRTARFIPVDLDHPIRLRGDYGALESCPNEVLFARLDGDASQHRATLRMDKDTDPGLLHYIKKMSPYFRQRQHYPGPLRFGPTNTYKNLILNNPLVLSVPLNIDNREHIEANFAIERKIALLSGSDVSPVTNSFTDGTLDPEEMVLEVARKRGKDGVFYIDQPLKKGHNPDAIKYKGHFGREICKSLWKLFFKTYEPREFDAIMDAFVRAVGDTGHANLFPTWEFSYNLRTLPAGQVKATHERMKQPLNKDNLAQVAQEVFSVTVPHAIHVAHASQYVKDPFGKYQGIASPTWKGHEKAECWVPPTSTAFCDPNYAFFYSHGLFNSDAARLSTSDWALPPKPVGDTPVHHLMRQEDDAMAVNMESSVPPEKKRFTSSAGFYQARYDLRHEYEFLPSSVAQVSNLARARHWTASPTAILSHHPSTTHKNDYNYETQQALDNHGLIDYTTPATHLPDNQIWFQSIDIDIDVPLVKVREVLNEFEGDHTSMSDFIRYVTDCIAYGIDDVVNVDLFNRLLAAHNYFSNLPGILSFVDINPRTFKPHFTVCVPPMRKQEHIYISHVLAATFFDKYADESHLKMAGSPHQMITRPGSIIKSRNSVRTIILGQPFSEFIPQRLRQNWLVPSSEDGRMNIINPADFMAHCSARAVAHAMDELGLSYDRGAIDRLATQDELLLRSPEGVFATRPKLFNPARMDPASRSDMVGLRLFQDGSARPSDRTTAYIDAKVRHDRFDDKPQESMYVDLPNSTRAQMKGAENYFGDYFICTPESQAPISSTLRAIMPMLHSWATDEQTVSYMESTLTTISNSTSLVWVAEEALPLMIAANKPYVEVSDTNDSTPSKANFMGLQGPAAIHMGLRYAADALENHEQGRMVLQRHAQCYELVNPLTTQKARQELDDLQRQMAERSKAVFDRIRNEVWYSKYRQLLIAPLQDLMVNIDDAIMLHRGVHYLHPRQTNTQNSDNPTRVLMENRGITGGDVFSWHEHDTHLDAWLLARDFMSTIPEFADGEIFDSAIPQSISDLALSAHTHERQSIEVEYLDNNATFYELQLTKRIRAYEDIWVKFLATGIDPLLETRKLLEQHHEEWYDERFGCPVPPGFLVLNHSVQKFFVDFHKLRAPSVPRARDIATVKHDLSWIYTGNKFMNKHRSRFMVMSSGYEHPKVRMDNRTLVDWASFFTMNDLPREVLSKSSDQLHPGELIIARLIDLWNERQDTNNNFRFFFDQEVEAAMFYLGAPLAVLDDIEAHKNEYFPLAHIYDEPNYDPLTKELLPSYQERLVWTETTPQRAKIVHELVERVRKMAETSVVNHETATHILAAGARKHYMELCHAPQQPTCFVPSSKDDADITESATFYFDPEYYNDQTRTAIDNISQWIEECSPVLLKGHQSAPIDSAYLSVGLLGKGLNPAQHDNNWRKYIFDGGEYDSVSQINEYLKSMFEKNRVALNEYGHNAVSLVPLATGIYQLLAKSNAPSVRWVARTLTQPVEKVDATALSNQLNLAALRCLEADFTTTREGYERQAVKFPDIHSLDSLFKKSINEDGTPNTDWLPLFVKQLAFLNRTSSQDVVNHDWTLNTSEVSAGSILTAWINEAANAGTDPVNTSSTRASRQELALQSLGLKYGLIKTKTNHNDDNTHGAESVEELYNRLLDARRRAAAALDETVVVSERGMSTDAARAVMKKIFGNHTFDAGDRSWSYVMSQVKTMLLLHDNTTMGTVQRQIMDAYHSDKKFGIEAAILSAVVLSLDHCAAAQRVKSATKSGGGSVTFTGYVNTANVPSNTSQSWSAEDIDSQLTVICSKMQQTTSAQMHSELMAQAEALWVAGSKALEEADERAGIKSRKNFTHSDEDDSYLDHNDEELEKRRQAFESHAGKWDMSMSIYTVDDDDKPHVRDVHNVEYGDCYVMQWIEPKDESSDPIPLFTPEMYWAFCEGRVLNRQVNGLGMCYGSKLLAPMCTEAKEQNSQIDSARAYLPEFEGQKMWTHTFAFITYLIALSQPNMDSSWDVGMKIATGIASWQTQNAHRLSPLTARYLESKSGVSAPVCAQAMKILSHIGLLNGMADAQPAGKAKLQGTMIGVNASQLYPQVLAEMKRRNNDSAYVWTQEDETGLDFVHHGGFISTYRYFQNMIMFTKANGEPVVMSPCDVLDDMMNGSYDSMKEIVDHALYCNYEQAVMSGHNTTPGDRRGKDFDTLSQMSQRKIYDLMFTDKKLETFIDALLVIAKDTVGKNRAVNPLYAHTSSLYRGEKSLTAQKVAYMYYRLSEALGNKTHEVARYADAFSVALGSQGYSDDDLAKVMRAMKEVSSQATVLFAINQAQAWSKRKEVSAAESQEFRKSYATFSYAKHFVRTFGNADDSERPQLHHYEITANLQPFNPNRDPRKTALALMERPAAVLTTHALPTRKSTRYMDMARISENRFSRDAQYPSEKLAETTWFDGTVIDPEYHKFLLTNSHLPIIIDNANRSMSFLSAMGEPTHQPIGNTPHEHVKIGELEKIVNFERLMPLAQPVPGKRDNIFFHFSHVIKPEEVIYINGHALVAADPIMNEVTVRYDMNYDINTFHNVFGMTSVPKQFWDPATNISHRTVQKWTHEWRVWEEHNVYDNDRPGGINPYSGLWRFGLPVGRGYFYNKKDDSIFTRYWYRLRSDSKSLMGTESCFGGEVEEFDPRNKTKSFRQSALTFELLAQQGLENQSWLEWLKRLR